MTDIKIPAKDIIRAEIAKTSHIEWMKYMWRRKDPFIIGYHTEVVCDAIDRAFDNYRKGISTYLQIKIPFRHGKTDMVGRYLVPRFLGEFPDDESMFATYASSLSYDISRFSRDLMKTEQYRVAYPDIVLKQGEQSVSEWGVEDHLGKAHYFGLGGGATGKGGSLITIDDAFKNREEAESEVIRDKRWNGITNDIFTRLAPIHMFIVMGTPWHIDDTYGRLAEKMKENPEFPRFEEIKIPYKDDSYPKKYLFLERFSEKWYKNMETVLGEYGTSGLLACDPMSRSGNYIKVANIKVIEKEQIPEDVHFIRVWDLASTEQQVLKDDPDYTCGALVGIRWESPKEQGLEPIPHLYVKDMQRFRLEAPARNERIKQIAMIDGAKVPIVTESVAGYKDTFTILWDIMKGIRTVEKVTPHKDKIARIEPVLPIIEAGNFSIVRGEWNQDFLNELSLFPSVKHDDQVDTISNAWARLRHHVVYKESDKFIMGKRR